MWDFKACEPEKPQFTMRKLCQDSQILNIYLIIRILLMYIAINQQFYSIQFAYKIGDFEKIVMLKYHLKKFYRGR